MEQSKKPKKTNATVRRHLTMVHGLGTSSVLMACSEPFVSPTDRVFVELAEVKMEEGNWQVMAVIYRGDGMRQVFMEDITNLVELDSGVNLREFPIPVLQEEKLIPAAKPRPKRGVEVPL